MTNYPTKKLGEVLELCDSGTWGEESPDGLPLLRSTNMQNGNLVLDDLKTIIVPEDKIDRYLLREGDILITKSSGSIDHIGKSLFITEKMDGKYGFSNFTQRLRVNQKLVLPKWVYLKISNPATRDFLLGASQTTTGLRNLKIPALKELEIPLPPLAEQKKIVAKLERVLAKISEAKKLRAEAQEAAQNLLPAELHKIFTTPHNTHTNKLENVGMSSTGKNGWQEKELGEICEINPKKSEIKNQPDSLPVSFVPMKAVDEFSQEITSLDERKLGEVRKGYTYFRDGDVLFAKITPCMENGKVAIAQNLKNGIGFGTTEFHVIRPKEDVLSGWIYAIIRHPEFRDVAKTKMTGSAGQKRVPVQFLETFKIPLPPLAEQKKIVAQLDSLSEKVGKIKNLQSATQSDFATLEQSVLSKAFSAK